MKKERLIIILLVFIAFTMFSCDKEDLFDQPSIEVTGYSLRELPGEYAYLDIDMLVTNNDSREALIKDVEYQVIIEGLVSEEENQVINQTIRTSTPLELTLPLTLKTNDAVKLLAKLDTGEELAYSVTGTFHVDQAVLKLFDLPINIEGTAFVDVGFEEFYDQPEVTVTEITGDYTINGITSYTFNLDADCVVENIDSRDVIIDEVEYVVFIEGVESETHLYSDTYSTDINIAGGSEIDLTLPVTLNLGITEGATLAAAMLDGTVSYTIEGTFHAIKVDGATSNFILPLYVTGSVPASLISP